MSKGKLSVILAVVALLLLPAGIAVAQEAEPVLISAPEPSTGVISDYTDDLSVVHLGGTITITINALALPAADTAYEGWLVSDDGSVKLSLGIIEMTADEEGGGLGNSTHTFNTSVENLIANYDKLVITVEPIPDPDPEPAAEVAYSASIPAGAIAHIRHLLTSWPPGSGKGILTNLQEQLGVAMLHAQLAAASNTLAGVKQHTEHFINAIEGPGGANYGDLDGNGSTQDFGDGVGVLTHADNRKHGTFAAGEAADITTVTSNAALVDMYGGNAETRALEARDVGLEIIGTSNLLLAQVFAANAAGVLDAALNGFMAVDIDTGEDINEPGAVQAYAAAQAMATYILVPGDAALATAAIGPSLASLSVGDSTVPILARAALIAALALIATGGLLMVGRRRSRKTA